MIKEIQSQLRNLGLYAGPIDGDWGPKTQAGYDVYMTRKGVYVPPWLLAAERELGVAEKPGPAADTRILLYHAHTTLDAKSDEVAWCSSFMNFVTDSVGIDGTNSAAARSWLSWGTEIDLLKYGCFCVFRRGSGGQGHIALGIAWDQSTILCLGGNQSNRVCVAPQAREKLIGIRWPTTAQLARLAGALSTERRRI